LVIKLPGFEIVWTSTGVIFILPKTDVSKTSVRNNLQRTGAELFDFLVLENILVKMVAKNKRIEMNYINILYKLTFEVNIFNINVKMLINVNVLPTPYQR